MYLNKPFVSAVGSSREESSLAQSGFGSLVEQPSVRFLQPTISLKNETNVNLKHVHTYTPTVKDQERCSQSLVKECGVSGSRMLINYLSVL